MLSCDNHKYFYGMFARAYIKGVMYGLPKWLNLLNTKGLRKRWGKTGEYTSQRFALGDKAERSKKTAIPNKIRITAHNFSTKIITVRNITIARRE